MGEEERIQVGVVVGTHGLRGDLKVRPLTGDSSALENTAVVFIRRSGGAVDEYALRRVATHKGNLLVRLEGLDRVEDVSSLVGCEVLMRLDDLAELPEDEFYWFELKGMSVIDRTIGNLGVLEDLFTTAAHDIYVVQGPYGEVLIPVVDEMVEEVDRVGKRIMVNLPEGLVSNSNDL